MTKNDIVKLAMQQLGWKEAKVLSWYKLENRWLGGNSPKELVNRGEHEKVVEFLMTRDPDLENPQNPASPLKRNRKLY